jgi:hypothetical protein
MHPVPARRCEKTSSSYNFINNCTHKRQYSRSTKLFFRQQIVGYANLAITES